MGASFSKTRVINEVVNETSFELVQKNATKKSTGVTTAQNISFNDTVIKGCKVNVANIANVDIYVLQDVNQQDTTQFISEIANKLESKLKNSIDRETELGAMAFSSDITDIRNEIKNTLKTKITSETINEIFTNVRQIQAQEFKNYTVDARTFCQRMADSGTAALLPPDILLECNDEDLPECNFTNDMALSLASMQLASKVTNTLMQNKNLTNSVADLEQKIKDKKTGFATLISAWTGPFAMVSIACVCGIILILFAFLAMGGKAEAGNGRVYFQGRSR